MERNLFGACLLGIAFALPTAAQASESAMPAMTAAAAGSTVRSDASVQRYDVAPNLPAPIRAAQGQASSEPSHSTKRVAPQAGATFASAPASIDGPALSYRTSRRGPVFEVAALGGGAIDNAPFLAHLGMEWRF